MEVFPKAFKRTEYILHRVLGSIIICDFISSRLDMLVLWPTGFHPTEWSSNDFSPLVHIVQMLPRVGRNNHLWLLLLAIFSLVSTYISVSSPDMKHFPNLKVKMYALVKDTEPCTWSGWKNLDYRVLLYLNFYFICSII